MRDENYMDKLFSIYEACYAYGVDYHSGQGSRAYRLLCCLDRKGFRAGLALRNEGYAALSEEGQAFYEHLMDMEY